MKNMNDFLKTFVVGLILLVMVGSSAMAQESRAERFRRAINFEDNEFVGMYNVEIKHGVRSVEGTEPPQFERTELNYRLTYGIFMNYEISLNFPLAFYDDGPDDLGDVGIAQKIKFTEQETSYVDSSGGIELIFPTGNDSSNPPTGSDEMDFRIFGSVGGPMTERTEWLLQSGYRMAGDDNVEDRFEYNGAVIYRVLNNMKINLEANGWSGGQPDNSEFYLSPGLIFHPRSGFSVTATLPVGINSDAADHRAQLELIHEF